MAIQRRVILCAGHGGGDSGAVGQGTTEANEVIDITNRAAHMLRATGAFEVHVVPHEFNYIPSIQWVNARWKGVEDAIAIEIHKNSGGGTGSEVWTPSHPDGDAIAYSQAIANGLAGATGQANRGVKQAQHNRWGRLAWCDDTNTYACLVEAGFIDRDPVGAEANERYARGITNGLMAYFGVQAAAPAPSVTTEQVRSLFLEILGREPDERGMKYYLDRAANHGWSIHRIRENIWDSPEANQYRERKRKEQEEANKPKPAPEPPKPQPQPTPPTPSDALVNEHKELEKRVGALEKMVEAIKAFLTKIFSGFGK